MENAVTNSWKRNGGCGSRKNPAWPGILLLSVLVISFLSVPQTVTAETGMTSIIVSGKTEISDADIRLGDIAVIRSEDPALVSKLQSLVIGAAPLPGMSRSFEEVSILNRLKQSDVDISRIDFQSPGVIEVTSKSIEISKKMIEDTILAYLSDNIPWDKNRVKMEIVQCGENLLLPDRPYTSKVVPPAHSRYLGNVPVSVVFETRDQPPKKVWATVRIEVQTDVVIVERPLIRNQSIEQGDVRVVSMNMADLPSNFIASPDDVIGKRVLRAMNPKEIFRTDIVDQPPLVKRSDRVTIVAESSSLKITAVGQARESGGKGDRIKVVNMNSNKEIYAWIVDPKTVRVEF